MRVVIETRFYYPISEPYLPLDEQLDTKETIIGGVDHVSQDEDGELLIRAGGLRYFFARNNWRIVEITNER